MITDEQQKEMDEIAEGQNLLRIKKELLKQLQNIDNPENTKIVLVLEGDKSTCSVFAINPPKKIIDLESNSLTLSVINQFVGEQETEITNLTKDLLQRASNLNTEIFG